MEVGLELTSPPPARAAVTCPPTSGLRRCPDTTTADAPETVRHRHPHSSPRSEPPITVEPAGHRCKRKHQQESPHGGCRLQPHGIDRSDRLRHPCHVQLPYPGGACGTCTLAGAAIPHTIARVLRRIETGGEGSRGECLGGARLGRAYKENADGCDAEGDGGGTGFPGCVCWCEGMSRVVVVICVPWLIVGSISALMPLMLVLLVLLRVRRNTGRLTTVLIRTSIDRDDSSQL